MAILGFELEEIIRLIALLESSGLAELVWEEEDRFIRIRAPRPAKSGPAAAALPTPESRQAFPHADAAALAPPRHPARQIAAAPTARAEPAADQIALASPMVGTFYRADKPGAPSLVEIGQHVEVGQTIGIIEAMKIFSEVPAEHAGTIIAIPAQDGQLVQTGTPLVILRAEQAGNARVEKGKNA